MNRPKGISLKIFICILTLGLTLYFHIDRQNDLTELRIAIPALAKEVKSLEEENTRLRFELEIFQNPVHLMELMKKPEYSHLKFPYLKDELILQKREN